MGAAPFPYRVTVAWSAEDECYVARAPALDALAAHGDTQEEAVRELRVAGEAMLAAMKEHARPVPGPDAPAYVVRFAFDGALWLATVEGLDGCHTQGRSLREAAERIAEAIGLMTDEDARGNVR